MDSPRDRSAPGPLDRRRFLAEAGRRGWPLVVGLLGPSLVPPPEEEDGAQPPPAPSAPPGVYEDLPAAGEMERLHRAFLRDNPDPDPWSGGPA